MLTSLNLWAKKVPQLTGHPWKGITLLRVTPTLAIQVIYSDIYFAILPNILSDIYPDILSGISSSILSGIYFGVLFGIYSGILYSVSHIFWHSLWHSICGTHFCSLSGIYSGSLSGIYSGIPSEVQRCPVSSEGPRLRSSSAHWARKVPGWGPAVPTALRTLRLRSSRAHSDRKPAVEVQQCPLRMEVGEEIGEERGSGGRGGGGEGGGRGGGGGEGAGTAVIKSNNPHLAGGEKPTSQPWGPSSCSTTLATKAGHKIKDWVIEPSEETMS